MSKATKADVVRVVRTVVERRRAGEATVRLGNHVFITGPVLQQGKVVGYCSRFVRQSNEEAQGLPEQGLSVNNGGWASGTARWTEEHLKAKGFAISKDEALPGDIICFNRNNGVYGHIAIWLGNNVVAENTSSGLRGNPREAGTKITDVSDGMWSHFSGFYAVLPKGEPPHPPVVTPPLRREAVVLRGKIIECEPRMERDGHMSLLAAPYLQALGVDPATIPAGVIHSNGRAYGAKLTLHCPGWVLTAEQFRLTPDGLRWYPQRVEWLQSQ